MKKIFYFLFALVLFIIGCSKPKQVDLLVGDPSERIADTLSYLKKTLVEAPNGWKAYLTTEYSGGYGFYIQFDENDRLKMVADLTDQSASELKESTYRVRQIMAATLSFDTYNYITMLQDPDPSVYGGAAGKGMGSDVEFDYVKTNGDTLFFEGRKFYKPLILVKATAEQQKAYTSGEYIDAIRTVKEFFEKNPVSYLESDGVKYQVFSDATAKNIDVGSYLDGKVEISPTENFSYTLDGIEIPESIKVGDKLVKYIKIDENHLFAITLDDEQIEILPSTSAIVPLSELMGVKYNGFRSPYLSYFPGTSEAGLTILKRFHEGLGNGATGGYYFNSGYIDLEWNSVNQRITLTGFSSQNGGNSGWNTTIVYDYVIDAETKQYTLTKRSNASGGYTSAILDQLDNFLLSSKFTLDYFFDSGSVYGKIKGIESSDVEMTFLLE